MKLERWTRFSWDLNEFALVYPAIDKRYSIREATLEDEKGVRAAVLAAFTLDPHWNVVMRQFRPQLDAALDLVFNRKAHHDGRVPCLVITHGARVIGASAMSAWREAENHLLTGPCILVEYRNRGLGAALLAHSLQYLKEADLKMAHGATRQGTPTEKFLYRKFNSVSAPYDHAPASVA